MNKRKAKKLAKAKATNELGWKVLYQLMRLRAKIEKTKKTT